MDGEPRRLVVGIHPVREAVRVHGAGLRSVLVAQRAGPTLERLARFAADSGVPHVERVSRAALDRLARGVSHQDVAAWAPPLDLLPLERLLETERFLGVALDAVQDPQNFGAVIRSAVGLADAAVVWAEHASAPLTPATFRASAGAIEHARLARVPSLVGALSQARGLGIRAVGLDASAPQSLSEIDLTGPTLIVVGSEHQGLGRRVRASCDTLARIGIQSGIDSLNASVAVAVALYEAARQRAISDT